MFYQIVVLIVLGLTQVHSQVEVAAAIIGSIITASTTFAPPKDRPPGNEGGCNWSGTAPICVGGCDPNAGYEDSQIRIGTCPETSFFDPLPDCSILGHYFGSNCENGGFKTLCCRGNKNDNEWNGQWESTYGDTWRCKVDLDVSAKCNGTLICENQKDERATWDIGHATVKNGVIGKPDCSKLEKDGKEEAEAFDSRITWTTGTNLKWFKV